MDRRDAVRDLLAASRRLVDGSREMVAASIARLIATNPRLAQAGTERAGTAHAPAEILLKLLHSPCDLDVLMFAERHPRALLGIDDIARTVGHDREQVRISVETLTAAGLIACTKIGQEHHEAGVLFYEFTPGTWGALLPALCWVATSPEARRVLRRALLRPSLSGPVAEKLQTR